MKKIITPLVLLILMLCLINASAQGPTISLVGSSPSFAKGNINTEVLTEIIQAKQNEVEERLFRNTIIKQFNKGDRTKDFRNFATYHYIYNLMDALISGKNKTAITNQSVKSSAEFAYVYAFAMYYNLVKTKKSIPLKEFIAMAKMKTFTKEKRLNHIKENPNEINDDETYKLNNMIFNGDIISYDKKNDKVHFNDIMNNIETHFDFTKGDNLDIDEVNASGFNLLIDACYTAMLENPKVKDNFQFKSDLSDNGFRIWYNNENVYKLYKDVAKGEDSVQLVKLKGNIDSCLKGFLNLIEEANEKGKKLKDGSFNFDDAVDLINQSDKYVDYPAVKDSLIQHKEDLKNILSFCVGLKKSEYKDFTLTKQQYYSLKYMIGSFAKVARNKVKSDGLASLLDFLMENSILEFWDTQKIQLNEEQLHEKDNSRGYLYVDVEAFLNSALQTFSKKPLYKIQPYLTPFLTIGVNSSFFQKSNTVLLDASGQSVKNMSYASEKIGIKYKIWNWKYTRSSPVGKYTSWYGHKYCWLRPQPEPFFSDVYVIAYGSGILYNVVNLKTNTNFNYAMVGASAGFTLFNGLSLNAGIAYTYSNNSFSDNNRFINFGMDIPIIEYLGAIRKKK